jgi:hypothetical protein
MNLKKIIKCFVRDPAMPFYLSRCSPTSFFKFAAVCFRFVAVDGCPLSLGVERFNLEIRVGKKFSSGALVGDGDGALIFLSSAHYCVPRSGIRLYYNNNNKPIH